MSCTTVSPSRRTVGVIVKDPLVSPQPAITIPVPPASRSSPSAPARAIAGAATGSDKIRSAALWVTVAASNSGSTRTWETEETFEGTACFEVGQAGDHVVARWSKHAPGFGDRTVPSSHDHARCDDRSRAFEAFDRTFVGDVCEPREGIDRSRRPLHHRGCRRRPGSCGAAIAWPVKRGPRASTRERRRPALPTTPPGPSGAEYPRTVGCDLT